MRMRGSKAPTPPRHLRWSLLGERGQPPLPWLMQLRDNTELARVEQLATSAGGRERGPMTLLYDVSLLK